MGNVWDLLISLELLFFKLTLQIFSSLTLKKSSTVLQNALGFGNIIFSNLLIFYTSVSRKLFFS